MWYLMYGKHAYSLTAFVSIPISGAFKTVLFKRSGQASRTATHWIYHSHTIKRPADMEPGTMVNITINAVRGLFLTIKAVSCFLKIFKKSKFNKISMFCKNSDLTKKQKLAKLIVLIKNSKTLGLSYQSDIGLDDIMVRPGPCPALQPVDATMPPVTTATTRPISSTKATTRTVATTMDPMVTREYNPFFTPKIESCTISTSFGEKTEQYISNMFICCGNKITSRCKNLIIKNF